MRRRVAVAIVGVLASLPVAAQAMDANGVETVEAPLIGAAGKPIGTVVIKGSASATLARITIEPGSLTPGWHGVHFHSVGDCSDHGKFQLSKGHVNHIAKKHGMLNPDGPDEGDLPNIMVNPDGSAHAEVSSLAVRILGQNGLKDSDGSAIVIHASEDDHTAQPIGNAGARVACAVLK